MTWAPTASSAARTATCTWLCTRYGGFAKVTPEGKPELLPPLANGGAPRELYLGQDDRIYFSQVNSSELGAFTVQGRAMDLPLSGEDSKEGKADTASSTSVRAAKKKAKARAKKLEDKKAAKAAQAAAAAGDDRRGPEPEPDLTGVAESAVEEDDFVLPEDVLAEAESGPTAGSSLATESDDPHPPAATSLAEDLGRATSSGSLEAPDNKHQAPTTAPACLDQDLEVAPAIFLLRDRVTHIHNQHHCGVGNYPESEFAEVFSGRGAIQQLVREALKAGWDLPRCYDAWGARLFYHRKAGVGWYWSCKGQLVPTDRYKVVVRWELANSGKKVQRVASAYPVSEFS